MKSKRAIPAQVQPVVSRFHSHLDECQQCRKNPFGLCLKGEKLLTDCVSEPMPREFSQFVSEHFWDLIPIYAWTVYFLDENASNYSKIRVLSKP